MLIANSFNHAMNDKDILFFIEVRLYVFIILSQYVQGNGRLVRMPQMKR